MGKSLYRAHRSLSFDEIVGQDHIVTMLTNSIKHGQISHAYLLCGPRGTGKTSIARILAHAVNNQPYSETDSNLDILEIDAASNRRIDEIREIRDQVNIAPSVGEYKIYIIDEVHMLTKEAFNALLKTLEEPPKHVIFVLATTEFNKVPETIISRCITLQFKPISKETLAKHLKDISKKEGIKIDDDALRLISEHSGGSFRDAITILEQVRQISDNISLNEVYFLLGLSSSETLDQIESILASGDMTLISTKMDEILSGNININKLAGQIGDHYRSLLLAGKMGNFTASQLLKLQKDLLDIPASSNQRISLELALFEFALNENAPQSKKLADLKASASVQEEVVIMLNKQKTNLSPKTNVKTSPTPNTPENKESIAKINANVVITKPDSGKPRSKENIWDDILSKLKSANSTLYGIARMVEVSETTGNITLSCKFAFHQKQLKDPKNLNVLNKIVISLTNVPTTIEILLIEKPKKTEQSLATKSHNNDTISNIFGEHEVVES